MRDSTAPSSARSKTTSCSNCSGELAVVGELSVDETTDEPRPTDPEDGLGLADDELDLVGLQRAGEAGRLLEGAGRHDRLTRLGRRRLERRLHDREPVGVRGDHGDAGGADADEDTGEHRTCVVTGCRTGDGRR